MAGLKKYEDKNIWFKFLSFFKPVTGSDSVPAYFTLKATPKNSRSQSTVIYVTFAKLNQAVLNVAIKILILKVVTFVKLFREVNLVVNLTLYTNHVIYVL